MKMKPLSETRKEETSELAEFIGLENIEGTRVNLLKIAEDRNITYSYNDYGEFFDGMLEYSENEFHIFINEKNRTDRRQRFTFAHELGHYFIDEHRNALISGSIVPHGSQTNFSSNLEIEREADLFASNLIMPESIFRAELKRTKFSLKSVYRFSEHFEISLTAGAVRMINTDLRPSALLKWTKAGLDWKLLSNSLYELGLRTTIDKVAFIVPGSPTEQALRNPTLRAEKVYSAGSIASVWFPNAPKFKDFIFVEESISIGEFGVLTLLCLDE